MKKILGFIKKHKIVSLIVLTAISAGGYFGYESLKGNKVEVRYVTAAVTKGTLVTSVSGSGQIAASDQVDIKAKTSGDLTALNATSGQEVKSGDILAQIDNSDAKKALRNAQTSLETARLELNKILTPAAEADVLKAENDLATAKRNLEELINPSQDTLSQAENALISAQDTLTKLKFSQDTSLQNAKDTKQKADDNLEKAYEDAYNAISSGFLDLPDIMTGLYNALFSYEIGKSEITIGSAYLNDSALINSILSTNWEDKDRLSIFIDDAKSLYNSAKISYDANLDAYKSTNRYSDKSVIESLLQENLETAKKVSDTAKSETNVFDFWVDYRNTHNLSVFSKVKEYQTNLASYTSKTNSQLSGLLSAQKTISDDKAAILDAERSLKELEQNQPLDLAAAQRSVKEKEDALNKLKNPAQYDIDAAKVDVKQKELALSNLKAGATDLDIRAKKIAVQQNEDTVATAQDNLANCDIRAPFDGVIAKLNVKKGDSVSSSAAVATIITKQRIAEAALNEVDAAKVKVGQKATLTFDAASDLSVAGEVAEIDTIGTVSQGVVSYNVKIAFDTQDERVKPGMSVSASIITDVKQDVLLAPISAVKSSANGSYVETLVNSKPQRKTVTTGSSSDTMIEITEGLEKDEEIITQTISAATATSSSSKSQSGNSRNGGGFMIPGMR